MALLCWHVADQPFSIPNCHNWRCAHPIHPINKGFNLALHVTSHRLYPSMVNHGYQLMSANIDHVIFADNFVCVIAQMQDKACLVKKLKQTLVHVSIWSRDFVDNFVRIIAQMWTRHVQSKSLSKLLSMFQYDHVIFADNFVRIIAQMWSGT